MNFDFVRAAEFYVDLKIPIFPVHIPTPRGCSCESPTCTNVGKHPRIAGFHTSATTKLSLISHWAHIWLYSNLGMPTGDPWPYVALDIDPRHGGDASLDQLRQMFGPLPPTIESITGSGGRHFLFATPAVTIRNSSGLVGAGIDVRGEHGFIVLPPSLHVSGNYYRWAAGHAPNQIAAAPMPSWLIELSTRRVTNASGRPDWRHWLPRHISEGERNSMIARLVGHLLYRKVDSHVALEIALSVNRDRCVPALDDSEVAQTVSSIAGCELRRRRGRK